MQQRAIPGLEPETYRVLFVCTGNICRSPTAEVVFRHMVASAGLGRRITADSAGTHDYHTGDPPDPRTIAAAKVKGLDMTPLRARKVRRNDFQLFDLIVAMDRDHYAHLVALKPNDTRADIKLLLEFHPATRERDVPDPYYGGPEGFVDVLSMIEEAAEGLLAAIRRELRED
jgi:protein-tyrosine phosphatase